MHAFAHFVSFSASNIKKKTQSKKKYEITGCVADAHLFAFVFCFEVVDVAVAPAEEELGAVPRVGVEVPSRVN